MSDETPKYDPLKQKEVIDDMFETWFLDYASYVILERAVPAIEDGLKPVQRRIMHALKEMDDGRFNKVANVIGSSMQYHPHGDASIGDAIVSMGQKNLLLDTQGNWGDVRTGDGAAAPRYIEVRLSKFANDVLFNEDTTEWQMSYDGRKREPVNLPSKFPLLLAQGVEGIAVGLSTKVMPHNFIELCEASISYLKNEPFQLYPDFLTGGLVDVTNYNDGLRGGKIKVRAKIAEIDKKTLEIQEIPFSTTTATLIDSIIKANDAGKIKIKKVEDNTAKNVSIIIHLAPNTSPDITIDALFAFTECENSISPNACIIIDNKPHFVCVSDILKDCTEQTKHLLQRELEIKRHELKEKLLYSSLEKIFIENKIYRDIEECTTFEAVVATVDKGLEPYKKDFYREIVEDDLLRLLEIRIKRISKFDAFKADELMKRLLDELAEVEDNLANLVRYTISFYKDLLKKYGKGRERKTEIRQFESVQATVVAANNQKLYVDRENGFVGYGLKKGDSVEYIMDCSDIDDVIAFKRDGKYVIVKIQEKGFVGKDIIYCSVFRKNDERKIYNVIYLDGKSGTSYAKRFFVTGITRDKEYDISMGNPKSKVIYFTANENGEAESVAINLTANSTAKKKQFDWDFTTLTIKNRSSMGNVLTKFPVRKIALKSAGKSTLGGVDIWFDAVIGKLNRDEHGTYLGNFGSEDKILVIYKDGQYEFTNFELTNRYEQKDILKVVKYDQERPISCLYYEGENKIYYIKRFKIETTTIDKKFLFITDTKNSRLLAACLDKYPRFEIKTKADKKSSIETQTILVDEFVEIRGWKAIGQKINAYEVLEVKQLEPKPEEVVVVEVPKANDVSSENDSENLDNQDDDNQLALF
jgi:topoisomerase-4 subunit A